jgi:hypothetical protein
MTDATQAKLSWTMRQVDNRLRVSYVVENTSSERLYVSDKLVAPRGDNYIGLDRLIVMNAGGRGAVVPGDIAFIRGAVSPERPSYSMQAPTFIAIDPRQRHHASVDVDLPLVAWHPLGGVDKLDGAPRTAVLQVHVFSGKADWFKLPSKDETPLIVPGAYVATVLSAPATVLPGAKLLS